MRVHVRVPATSANLGPGFDVLGLALALHNELTLEEAERTLVSIEGEGVGALETGTENIVARAARLAFEAAGRRFHGVAARSVNRIPLSRGLGSSAAAWVAGLVGANALLGSPLARGDLLTLAARAEGHPDNVAAALHGGFTVSCMSSDRALAVPVAVPEALSWVVLVPKLEGRTAETRAALPPWVSRADAVWNLQRTSLLIAALAAGRIELLLTAMDDRLHQPYRLAFFPWMERVAAAARSAGALGCVLSGAGPSLLAVAEGDASEVGAAMESALRIEGQDGRALPLAVDTEGAVARAERGEGSRLT
ncbi:MAG: homoserine kinase [Candidatus Rokubacteria bacterium]|nr:homoserine kinase [Candidatus Rokubacteria bacterium]